MRSQKMEDISNITIKKINNLSFKILQAARVRVTSTDFISCPSCGRTLFDLQETTAMIRERTDHLKGLKIGIPKDTATNIDNNHAGRFVVN